MALPPNMETQVSGLATRLEELPEDSQKAAATLRSQLGPGLSDASLVRFLIARNWDVAKAAAMARTAIAWREKRQPDWILAPGLCDEAQELEFADQARTGKTYVPGRDKYG